MTAFQKKFRRFVKRTPLGPPLRTAWRQLRRIANHKPTLSLFRKPIDQLKAEITKHAMYRLQDFLISGQMLPFPVAAQPVISVVLVLFNRAELTFRCLRSLKENTHLPIEIIVIDNRVRRSGNRSVIAQAAPDLLPDVKEADTRKRKGPPTFWTRETWWPLSFPCPSWIITYSWSE